MESEHLVEAAHRQFDEAWDALWDRIRLEAGPEFGALDVQDLLSAAAETDAERLLAAAFCYNIDDETTSIGQAKARARNLFAMLAGINLYPIPT